MHLLWGGVLRRAGAGPAAPPGPVLYGADDYPALLAWISLGFLKFWSQFWKFSRKLKNLTQFLQFALHLHVNIDLLTCF